MGLASALSTSLTGLNAAETTIDVIGNNLANANTVGFKESNAVFMTQLLQTLSLGSAPTSTSGGTNPRQVGLGTKVAEIKPDFTQGTVEISANPLDLAIQGDGFFIVEGNQGEQFYTRNGQFNTNAENQLVSITGNRLLGFGIDDNFQIDSTALQPITIPVGAAAVAQATENVYLEGSLDPDGVIGDTPGIMESAVLSDGSLEVPSNLGAGDIMGVDPPNVSATTPTGAVTGGSVGPGIYRYKVVMVDNTGNEGGISTEIGPLSLVGPNDTIDLSNIPTADGTTFVDRNIYRTDATGTGDYQYVGNLGDAVTTSFQDTLADASLGATLNDDFLTRGNYSYYVTYFNTSSGLESRPTARVGPVPVTLDDRRVRLQNLPQPASTDFNAVRIYRNLSTDPNSYYRVAELTGGETSYIDDAADSAIEIPGNEISLDGPSISFGLGLLDLVRRDGATYENVFEAGTLSMQGVKGGRTLAEKQLVIDAGTTVQDYLTFVEEATGIQRVSPDSNYPIPGNPGGTITADSRLQLVSNMGTGNALDDPAELSITTAAGVREAVSLPFTVSQEANGESAVADFVVYDSLGIPLRVRTTAVLESRDGNSTTFRWFADSPNNDPTSGVETAVGTGVMTFDGEGNILSVSESTVAIDRRNIPSNSPLQFEIDFSQISGLKTDASLIAATRQDGFPAGTLSSFAVTENGTVRGTFSNGAVRDLGQVRMVRFANNGGLEQKGQNLFATGENSGLPIEGNPGGHGIGSITAGAVELSNTDIGQNLIDLILASTHYRGGTRVITTVQQLFDELLALRR
jgi:flagellar hook protein FlgE